MTRVLVGKTTDIPSGKMKGTQLGSERVLVANVDGKFYAMRSICNHMGGPLQEGKLEGKIVTCPWHGSKWDVTTGKLEWFARPLNSEPTYKVIIEGEQVFIEG